eukprot:4861695-Alexandrium_andersonii.AAC.1
MTARLPSARSQPLLLLPRLPPPPHSIASAAGSSSSAVASAIGGDCAPHAARQGGCARGLRPRKGTPKAAGGWW